MKRLLAWAEAARPLIVLISVFGSLTGALNVTLARVPANQGVELPILALMAGLLGAACLAAGLMIHNDITDYASDQVNRPTKPIVSGQIGLKAAHRVSMALLGASVLLAFLSGPLAGRGGNWTAGGLTVLVVGIGLIYNVQGKYSGLWGHAAVAFGVGAIPLWGAVVVRPGRPDLMLPLALAIFVMEIGREIMVCVGDLQGDLAAGFRTVPVRWGRGPSLRIALLFYLASIPLFPIPALGWFGFPRVFSRLYLVGAGLFLLILLLTWQATVRVVRRGSEEQIWRAFERYIRLGTRLGVLGFQVVLFLEAFL